MTKAIGYVRRSTDRQEESLKQQREKLEAYAKSRGWTLAAVYCDDAISGSELSRPGLDELFSAASDPEVEIVLAWDRNRLARPKDALDGLLLERRLQQQGKRAIYAATGQESDRSFASGLISYIEHYQNGDYLHKLSRDTMRGQIELAKRGRWPGGPVPFGYDRLILDGETPKRIIRSRTDGGQLVLDPRNGEVLDSLPKGKSHKKQDHETCTLIPSELPRVRAIQKLFSDYASGVPTRRLRDDLNAAWFRTSRGQGFTVQTIIPMLENPAYAGRCVYNRRTLSKWHRFQKGASVERHDEGVEHRPQDDWIVCEDAWPALVDAETFNAVQERRKESKEGKRAHYRGNAMRSEYLLSGRMLCGVCGGKLTGSTTTSGKGVKTRYYTCSRYAAGHREECPERYTVPADIVEQHILTVIRQDVLNLREDKALHRLVEQELQRLNGGKADAREQLQRRQADLDQRLAKLRDHLLALDPETARSLGLYAQAQQASSEREEIEQELAALKEHRPDRPTSDLRDRIASEFERIDEVMSSGTLEERRELIGCYVSEIRADPDQRTVRIGFYPTLLSQRIAGVGFEPTTSGL